MYISLSFVFTCCITKTKLTDKQTYSRKKKRKEKIQTSIIIPQKQFSSYKHLTNKIAL